MKLKRTKRLTAHLATLPSGERPKRRTRWRKKTEIRHALYGRVECLFATGCHELELFEGEVDETGGVVESRYNPLEGCEITEWLLGRQIIRWRYVRFVSAQIEDYGGGSSGYGPPKRYWIPRRAYNTIFERRNYGKRR